MEYKKTKNQKQSFQRTIKDENQFFNKNIRKTWKKNLEMRK